MRSITIYNLAIMAACTTVSVFGLVLLVIVDGAFPELRTDISVWEAPVATLMFAASLAFICAGPFLMSVLIDDGRHDHKPGRY